MKCVALLSGGKDSVAALDIMRQHGHDVDVALAMVPAGDDAWMFHTPNLHVLPAVARCLGVTLVEAPCRIGGDEEVEDLETALRRVMDDHDVEAIVSGALASEYQRTRIDRIGHRLGLKTFAPLWHKDPRAHLGHVTGPLWDVRIVRTAAEGLGPDLLGRRLDAALVDHLASLRPPVHVAGEGGEFETLVLDAPCYHQPLVIEDTKTVVEGGRATWVVRRWRTKGE